MSLKLPDTGAETAPDGRRLVPSAQRNAPAILEVLKAHAPRSGQPKFDKICRDFPWLAWLHESFQ